MWHHGLPLACRFLSILTLLLPGYSRSHCLFVQLFSKWNAPSARIVLRVLPGRGLLRSCVSTRKQKRKRWHKNKNGRSSLHASCLAWAAEHMRPGIHFSRLRLDRVWSWSGPKGRFRWAIKMEEPTRPILYPRPQWWPRGLLRQTSGTYSSRVSYTSSCIMSFHAIGAKEDQ